MSPVATETQSPGRAKPTTGNTVIYTGKLHYERGRYRANRRTQAAVASEPMQFTPYGEITDAGSELPAVPAMPIARTAPAKLTEENLVRPPPGGRSGVIDVDLTTGVRLTVDSYINEKALARVLRALRDASC